MAEDLEWFLLTFYTTGDQPIGHGVERGKMPITSAEGDGAIRSAIGTTGSNGDFCRVNVFDY